MAIPIPQKIVVPSKEFNEQFLTPINIVCEPGGKWTLRMDSYPFDGDKELIKDKGHQVYIPDIKAIAAIEQNSAAAMSALLQALGTIAYLARANNIDNVTPEIVQGWIDQELI